MFLENVVVMRALISEDVDKKRYHARVFLLMAVTLNKSDIIGPLIGGLLEKFLSRYLYILGPGSLPGGNNGVSCLKESSFALPYVIMAGLTPMIALLAKRLTKNVSVMPTLEWAFG